MTDKWRTGPPMRLRAIVCLHRWPAISQSWELDLLMAINRLTPVVRLVFLVFVARRSVTSSIAKSKVV
jgi:hypothetical protein